MKKTTVVIIIALFVFVLAVTLSVFCSFNIVRPTTKSINNKLEGSFSKLISIPKDVTRPTLAFNQISYFWEMETPQKEVAGVIATYTPSYLKNEENIELTLEMKQDSDPSIFSKVLPAVILDKKSLDSAREKGKEDLSSNLIIGYREMAIDRNENGQPTRIYWRFKKGDLGDDLKSEYKKLETFPTNTLRIFYEIPNFIIGLFAA